MKILKKILFTFCIGYPLYFMSFLFTRKKRLWIFSSGKNFNDNTKYLFLDVINNHHEIEAVWLSSNKELIKKLQKKGLRAYYTYSLKGIASLLTANIYVVSYISNDHLPIWFIGKAKLINLWHGVGIKNIYFGSNREPLHSTLHHPIKKYIYSIFRLELYRKPNLFISTSSFMNQHFRKCFKLKKNQILESKYPRNELLQYSKSDLQKHIDKYENSTIKDLLHVIKKYKCSYIYMPTWRPNNPNFLEENDIDFSQLNELMKKKNSLFIFKLHPETPFSSLNNIKNYSNLILLNKDIDIYPLLPFTECLITDYSSIYYDYLLLKNKSVIFYLFDHEDYIKNNQDLIMDFDDATEGTKVYNFKQLIDVLKQDLPLPVVNLQKKDEIKNLFWGNNHNKNNLIKSIKSIEEEKQYE